MEPTISNAHKQIAAHEQILVPLNCLIPDPDNARKTPAVDAELGELVSSIRATGFWSSLTVRPHGRDMPDDATYAVTAGARRHEALRRLAECGDIAPTFLVPCIVNLTSDATEVSLAENVVRNDMHPADQFMAFSELHAAGNSVPMIATRFGVSDHLVRQRLRLGDVAPELIDAYRENKFALATLMAFSITTDRERQLAVYNSLAPNVSPWNVKSKLTDGDVPASAAIAKFVGVSAYQHAGGRVLDDLFAGQSDTPIWLVDSKMLDELALDKLTAEAQKLSALDKWKWVTPMVDDTHQELARFGKYHGTLIAPSDEEQAKLAEMRERETEIEGILELEDGYTEALSDERDELCSAIYTLEKDLDGRRDFTDEERAHSGCIVTFNQHGLLTFVQGLIDPDDMAEANSNASKDASAATRAQMPDAPSDPKKAALKAAGYNMSLADDMRSIRGEMVKAHLATNFGSAFDLFVFQAARDMFNPRHLGNALGNALNISVKTAPSRPLKHATDTEDTFGAHSPGEVQLKAVCNELELDWVTIEDREASFAAFRDLSAKNKQSLFAACVGLSTIAQLSIEHDALPELESVISKLKIPFEKYVRPSSDIFWSKLTRANAIKIANEVVGENWVSLLGKIKKGELDTRLASLFAMRGPEYAKLPRDIKRRIAAWVPPGF